uniref:CSON015455 protein n=1 Tax=Culicoides sonorensis TaxID=179676 RepID=A0A336MDG2_CULSO
MLHTCYKPQQIYNNNNNNSNNNLKKSGKLLNIIILNTIQKKRIQEAREFHIKRFEFAIVLKNKSLEEKIRKIVAPSVLCAELTEKTIVNTKRFSFIAFNAI